MQRIVTFVVTVLAFAVGPASALPPLAETSPPATLKGLLPTLPDISFRSKPTSAMVFKERMEGIALYSLPNTLVSIGEQTTSAVKFGYGNSKLVVVTIQLPANSGAAVLSTLRARWGEPELWDREMAMGSWKPRKGRPYFITYASALYTLLIFTDAP